MTIDSRDVFRLRLLSRGGARTCLQPDSWSTAIIGVSLHSAISGIPAAMLEGAVVALPRAAPLARLERLRSPGWTVLLPGSIIVGTFGLLLIPSTAWILVLAAAVTTPVLALLAVMFVTRARPLTAAAAATAGGLALLAAGIAGHLGSSLVTALACVTVGAALARLIPRRWLLVGVLAMAAVDAVLLATGFGYHQTALLAAASNSFHGPRFTGARVGGTTIGYPDLFLAALVGACLAGGRDQRRAAVLVTALAIACDSMLSRGVMLPATVPIALALAVVVWWRRRASRRIEVCPGCRQPICRCSSVWRRPPTATWSTSAAATAHSSGGWPRAGHG